MDSFSILTILLTSIPFIGYGIGYLMKSHLQRIDELEDKVNKAITEDRLRVILEDKVTPLRDDIKELKQQLSELTSILLKK